MTDPTPAAGRAARLRFVHRSALAGHFGLMLVGLAAAFLANRFLSPERFWAQWLALVWGAAFAAHLAVFSRATLDSMSAEGRKRLEE